MYVLCGVILLITCFKKPRWETNFTIPLMSKTFSVNSLIDTNYFNINNDSTIDFYLTSRLDTVFPIDSIRILNRTDSSKTALPDFVIRNLTTDTIGFDASEITSLSLPDTTVRIIVPAFTRKVTRACFLSNIGSMLINSGIIKVNITNGTHLTFDSANCALNGINIIRIPTIDSISTNEYSFLLENIVLDSIMTFNVLLAYGGSGTDSIPISGSDSLSFIISIDSLRIQSGSFSSIPPRLIRTDKQRIYNLPVNYQFHINALKIHNGLMRIDINNQFPFSCSAAINIAEFDFDTSLVLNQFSASDLSLDLINRLYHNDSSSLTPLTINYSLGFLLDSMMITVTPENYYKIRYQITDIRIDSVAGTIIDTIQYNFSSDTISINLPDFLTQVQAVNASATFDIINGLTFPILLDLNIIAKNSQNDSASLDTICYINAGTPANPTIKSLVVDFNSLFNIHPDKAIINVQITTFGDGWLNRQSFINAGYAIISPMQVMLRADTLYFNPTRINIAQNIRNMINEDIDTCFFYAHLQNHIPTRLSGKIILENLKDDTVNLNINLPKGIINNSGYVTTAVDTNIAITLNDQQAKIFADSIVNVSVIIYIPDTDTIMLTTRDYFKIVNSYAQIQTKLKP